MDDSKFEEWVASLTLRGGEAFLPGEPVPAEKRRHIRRRQRERQGTDWRRIARSLEGGAL